MTGNGFDNQAGGGLYWFPVSVLARPLSRVFILVGIPGGVAGGTGQWRQVVVFGGDSYRLNRKAVADIIQSYHLDIVAACAEHICHLHIVVKGMAAALLLEHRLYPRDDGAADIPCPEGHGRQAWALLEGRRVNPCRHCGEHPHPVVVAENVDPAAAGYFVDPAELRPEWSAALAAAVAA